MKLPKLPDEEENKISALNLPSLDKDPEMPPANQGLPKDLKLPSLIEFDNMLEDEADGENYEFADIPIGQKEEKIETSKMFDDLPLKIEFKEPEPMFEDIPMGVKDDKKRDKIELNINDIELNYKNKSISEQNDKEFGKERPTNIEDNVNAKNKSIEDLEDELESEEEPKHIKPKSVDEMMEEFEELEDEAEEELEFEDEEIDDIEEFSFLPQVNFEELEDDFDEAELDKEIDLSSQNKNEFDEEKIKEFFKKLKDKFKKKDSKKTKLPKEKKTKIKKPGFNKKINSKKIMSILTYAIIIIIFIGLVFFTIKKLNGSSSVSPIDELKTSFKLDGITFELDNFWFDEEDLVFNITNKGDESKSFFMNAKVTAKSGFKNKKIDCESGIVSVAPNDIISEKLYCDKLVEGDNFKIKIDIEKVE